MVLAQVAVQRHLVIPTVGRVVAVQLRVEGFIHRDDICVLVHRLVPELQICRLLMNDLDDIRRRQDALVYAVSRLAATRQRALERPAIRVDIR